MNDYLSTDQLFISKLTEIVLDHLTDEEFTVERLAQEAGMSRVNLYRRLKSIKNQDVSKFIREIRLQRAMEMLRNKQGTAAEIAFRVGFGSPAYFNKCFREYFGYPPGKVNRKGSFKKKERSNPAKSWKIASYASIILVFGLVGLIVIPRMIGSKPEKSIAVLPFKYLSDDPGEQYLADGVMEEILLNLSAIEELLVLDRTSVEQFRETDKTANEICQELGVNYLLEGSFLKKGDQARLLVNLIGSGKIGHVWGNKYDESWENIMEIQSKVAQSVAKELQAVITPEEKQLIEKPPTSNLAAYEAYLRGREEERKHLGYFEPHLEALEKARIHYNYALEIDSTFARAHLGLARIYYDINYLEGYFSENFIDSALILVNKSLSYDDQLADAYSFRGEYYRMAGDMTQAIIEYDKAIELNPNDWFAYYEKGILFRFDDIVNCLENYYKAASRCRGPELPGILREIAEAYNRMGFPERRIYYSEEALDLDGDSVAYYVSLGGNEYKQDNLEKAIEYYKKGYAIDSTDLFTNIHLHIKYEMLGQYEKALFHLKKRVEIQQAWLPGCHLHFGLISLQIGDKQEAEYHFNKVIEIINKVHDLNRGGWISSISYYHLASVYAIRGETAKACENLKQIPLYQIVEIESDPMFSRIKDEREFLQLIRDREIEYQAERKRVTQWLEENDML